ncbi:uncharacterized protein Z518_09025 [Rhinocladiella mackenziei CBS 650.93]|uniref:Rhinocladiella mackenziei CBS 650.93 unplaced genomic scaffold supercont1.7, whole genome shotgun sequence n=1 Tax=Rhinocladiella mackenziei CBS 650.93 TaxID=1442369 RepID=A0A0D2IXH6_9EURO|nr:uncharacterized protein Z518_09025 [Rhinocladiella mackenziei CBS 650.93]KIX01300.1 hypothetical protein Z518_09025 [Rhinocladiella mackenziei CBS 650.93]
MPLQIAIIGAGLGGPALALELLKVPGITCTIYELRPEGYEQGQHISLAPNAMRIMKHIGVIEKLNAIGHTYEALHLCNAKGARIATFHNGHEKEYGFGAMRVHRRYVQQVLIEECKAKGVEIRHGMKLKEIREYEAKRTVEMIFTSGQTAQADFIVGVDGLHSAVRDYLAPNVEPVYAKMLGVTGFLHRNRLHSSAGRIGLPAHFIGPNAFIAIMPSDVWGNDIGFFSTMDFNEEKSREDWDKLFHDKDAIRAILRELFSTEKGWSDLVAELCDTAEEESLCSWPFFIAPPLPNWYSPSGRVLVMGDAAHAMIPTGGLGASLAFEDAECLALLLKHLAPSHLNSHSLQQTLPIWEAHRQQRLALVQEFTNRNRRLRQPGGSWQYLKEWFVWLFFKVMGRGGQAEEIYRYDTEVFAKMLPAV